MLKTVLNTLCMLELLSQEGKPVRLSELARRLQISRSSAHRILQTLASRSFVAQDKVTRLYSLGLGAWFLGRNVLPERRLLDAAQPILEQINIDTGETVYLALLDGASVRYAYAILGTNPVKVYEEVGSLGPIHSSATGKAILAFLPSEVFNSILTFPLTAFTPHTITSRDQLLQETETIRKRRYAIGNDEMHLGVGGVGAAILDQSGNSFAAIGISCPTSRITEDFLTSLGQTAKTAAADITRLFTHLASYQRERGENAHDSPEFQSAGGDVERTPGVVDDRANEAAQAPPLEE